MKLFRSISDYCRTNRKHVFIIIGLVIVLILSMTVFKNNSTDVSRHQHEIDQIDSKIDTVLELTAASTVSSALISVLPDDTATPIADQLADLSSYFLIALCALYLEKYLLTLVGFASFGVLLPLAILIGCIALTRKNGFWQHFAIKLALFAVIIYAIIPTSVKISDIIYQTYSSSIEETINKAEDTANTLESDSDEEEEGLVDRVLDFVQNTATTVTSFATDTLSNFIEALAVMLVTSCLIPVLVLAAFVWLAKLMLSIPVPGQNVLQLPEYVLRRLER